MRSDNLLKRINKLNSTDKMVQNVFSAIGAELDIYDGNVIKLNADQFFDTCSMEKLRHYEKEAGVNPLSTQDEAGRRSAVEAKWKSSGKVDIEMLQSVADSWKNGKVDVDFVENKIQITFVDQFGLPADREGLEIALDEVKPAHLPIVYFVKYLMINDVEQMTLKELESHLLSDFSFM